MNIQGGGLSFDISGNNKQLISVLNESKKAIQEFQGAAVLGGKQMDGAFTRAAQAIDKAFAQIDVVVDTNKAAIAELEAEYKRLGVEASKALSAGHKEEAAALQTKQAQLREEITLRQTVIDEAGKQADALLREEQQLRKAEEAARNNANAQISLRTQLRNVREQLGQMEEAGLRGTDTFRKLQQEAGRLANAIGDAQTQARIFSHDNAGLQGMIAGLSGVAGAFSTAQGAVALFAGENENLQKIMLKVQALMSITMGLQQVANALNKDSAFMLVTVAKAKELLSAATNRLTVALGGSVVAAKALMATLTFGLSVAITAAIYLWDKYSSKAKDATKANEEAKKVFDEYHKSTASKSADLVGKYQRLRDEYNNLKSAAEKQEWIKNNASEFDSLSLSVNNLTDADNVFIKNTKSVVKALELRAKALALQELQMKAYEQYYQRIIAADQSVAGGGFYTKVGNIIKQGTQDQKDLGAAMKAAGAVSASGDAYNKDNEWYTMSGGDFKLTQKAIDAINAYRVSQARSTNQRIHSEAQAELDKTVGYTRQQIALTEKELKELDILRTKGSNKPNGNGSSAGSSSKNEKDPFAEQLATRKGLYEKYLKRITSSDETVRNAAASEFAPLLKEGSSYLQYLENQRAAIEAKTTKTAADLKNLTTLNNEIANATRESVISAFDAQLQQELAQCKTISEMLATIERRRSELSGDNSDVDNAKAEILNTAEADTLQQAKEETKALLQEYAGYLQEKIDFEESYARKKELLSRQAAESATDAERQVAEAALAALEKEREEYAKRSGNEQYDALLEEYQTYQQQETAILEKYAAQRALAEQQGNASMIAQINAKQQSELSKLAAQRLMASESWGQLFSDISRLSTTTINRLLNDINSRKINLSAEFNPADLKAINDQLQKAKNELATRNPFLALRQSLSELRAAMKAEKLLDSDDPFVKSLEEKKKQYADYTDAINSSGTTLAGAAKEAYADLLAEGSSYVDMLHKKIATLNGLKIKGELTIEGQEQLDILNAALNKETGVAKSVGAGFKEAFGDLGSSLTFLSSCFGSVTNGIKKMGISMDEETEAILGDIGGMLDGASQIATGIATANPLSIIQGSIGFLSSAFDLFNSRDRKAEKSIKKHEEAVTRLGRAYTALEHAVDNALGETVYQNQSALIQNLRQQQNEIQGMINDEISKKKTDWGRVEEFQERYDEAGRQIEDIIAEITESITQTSAGDLANELKDALIEAFESGEDAAKVFGDVADNVLKNAVSNALKLQFLEKPLQNAIKQLQKDMGFDAEGNGSFDGLTQAEQDRFKAAVAAAGQNFKAAMDMYKDLFAELDESDPTSLSGAIKGASQESIDLLAGQTNAVRQNQVIAIEIFRQQLIHLSSMDNRLGNIAGSLLSILNRLGIDDGDDLRSQGITD
ncbi:hypothetical protein NF347_11710 [Paramuribaculum intestinale]|uniref:hypothetical protein n=2 Tax=Paramuribaculum intestinale TaxID=2094151 RepID=UPI002740A86D|nr:hypothetical protein [Paramuribaculum intestinale]WLT41618.1 hypothetical protein NF347_11710 [Paramuribaculum intestinale]